MADLLAKSVSERKSILVLHGPNLNLLGMREPEHYGKETLDGINRLLTEQAQAAGITLETFQSNSEADLVGKLHTLAGKSVDFIIINPAAFTHTSVALRDALAAVKIPFIEVHLSNVYAREPFRHHSYFSDIAVGVISGLGAQGYASALSYAINKIAPSQA
ncbi:MAG TPA: type II 3-dehydroquinate dehydratase [Methylophilaceae bacterium]|nr:type II 3-dehydroquinate dehydratase [Methylophilaceae bacterium]